LAIAPHRLYVETVLAATPTRKRPRDEKVKSCCHMRFCIASLKFNIYIFPSKMQHSAERFSPYMKEL